MTDETQDPPAGNDADAPVPGSAEQPTDSAAPAQAPGAPKPAEQTTAPTASTDAAPSEEPPPEQAEAPAAPDSSEEPPKASAAPDSPEEPPPPEEPRPDQRERGLLRNMSRLFGLGHASTRCVIVNQTGRRIGIGPRRDEDTPSEDGVTPKIILAPFGEREIDKEECADLDIKRWKDHNLVEVTEPHEHDAQAQASAGVWVRLWGLALPVILGLQVDELRVSPWYWLCVGGLVLWLVVWIFQSPPARVWVSRVLNIWVVLGIGVGIPVAADWVVGGDLWLEPDPQFMLGRAVHLVLVSVAAMLPALLYYLFDRQQLATLRQSFYRRVIELEPKILTVEDAKSTYGGQVAEVYGSEGDVDEHSRFTGGSRLPILIATLCLAAGWLLVLPPQQAAGLTALLTPSPTALSYGFLGAYFFSIGMILRRYTRADLKPKTYGHVTVRLLLTMVLVWALSVIPTWEATPEGGASPYLLLLAFMVGIVPDTGLMVVRQFLASGKLLRARIDSLDERLPLSKVDGITLYDQARLAEEGIENIQNLVYYDLVDLVLQTRIPLHRLVDWVDQGILIMHLDGHEEQKPLVTLRRHGIRNASDLVAAYAAAARRGEERSLVKLLGSAGPTGLPLLQIVFDALHNDEWFESIVLWRDRSRLPGEHVFEFDEMFLSHDDLCVRLGVAGMLRPTMSACDEAYTAGSVADRARVTPEPHAERPVKAVSAVE